MSADPYARLHLWLVAHRRAVIIFTLLISAICIAISSRIDLEEDVIAMLPQGDKTVADYRYTLQKFRQIDRVFIDIGIESGDFEKLGRAADEVHDRLATNSAFARVMYRFEMGGQQKIINYLTGALPNLFTESDATALAGKLDTNSIREFLTVMRRKLSGPEGMVLKDVIAADPVGMSGLVIAKVMPLQAGFGDVHIDEGRVVSTDNKHILLIAEPKFASSNSRESEILVSEMLRVSGEVERKYPGVRVAITGGHRMAMDNATLIKRDAKRCVVIGTAAMLVLCLTAYRRRWLAVVTFLPSFFGTLAAGVVLFLWWHQISGIAMGFATIAIGITVDYAIYVIYHLDNAAGLDRERVGRHIGRLVVPISVGSLTTVAAFVVMASSPVRGYQQLGVFGAVGVIISAVFAIVVLPLLIPIPKKSGQPPLWLTRLLDRFHAWRSRSVVWLLALVIVLSIASIGGVARLRFEGDIAKMNGITDSTRRDEELIRQTWGDALGMTLVVARGSTVEEALEKNDRAAGVLARDPDVKAVYSLAAICPSLSTQEKNIARWREFWTQERRDSLRLALGQIGDEMGFRPGAFASFWRIVETRPAMLTLDAFRGTPLEQALSERAALAEGDNAIGTLLQMKDRSRVSRLKRELSGFIVVDGRAFSDHIAALAKKDLGYFALWTSVIVAAIIYLTDAAIGLVLATLLPLAIGLLWTFGMMGWFGLPIDMMNCVFVIFVIGVAEDYSIFLVTSRLDEWRGHPQRIASTSASVVISALTTLFGFAVLAVAKHPVLFSMGTTVLLGMVSAFVATLIITPLCMDLLLYRDPPRGAPCWWHPLVTLWVGFHVLWVQIVMFCLVRPLLKMICPRTADERVRRATGTITRWLISNLMFIGKLEYKDISEATFKKPSIIVSNHQSAVDVVLSLCLPGDIRQAAKKRIFDTPILGIGCKILGHVMVEPNNPAATMDRCRIKLGEGASVHFYPEGTRSPDGYVRPFHRGAFELAVALNQEITPLIFCDTWTAMPRDAYWFEPYHAVVRALPRITPQNFDYALGARALMQHCEQIIRNALQRELDTVNTPCVVRRKVSRLYRYQGQFVEQFVHWKMKLDPIFKHIDRLVPRNGFVLDLGCGYGITTHWLYHFTDTRTFLGVDYDENKIRVARRTAPFTERVRFEQHDILEWDFPECDTVLLHDVLHYWVPEKQDHILAKVRRALRPGGRLVLRDAARADSAQHRNVHGWEKFATRIGHNVTREGLHFLTLDQITAALRRAGFTRSEVIPAGGRDSNVLIVATVEEPSASAAQTP